MFSLVSSDPAFWCPWADKYGNEYGFGPWLGGFQLYGSPEPDGNWQWVTGEPFSYTNWEINQPDNFNNDGNQNRLRFFKAGGLIGDRWDDEFSEPSANVLRGYIIEWDPPYPFEFS